MSSQRVFAAMFLLGQVGLFVWLDAGIAAPSVALICLLASLLLPDKWRLPNVAHLWFTIGFGVWFALIGLAAALRGSDLKSLFQLFAELLLIVQALELLRKPRELGQNYLPGLGGLSLALLMLSLEPSQHPPAAGWIYAAFITAQFLVMREDLPSLMVGTRVMREKAWTLILVLLAMLSVAVLFQNSMERDLQQLRRSLGSIQASEMDNAYLVGSDASFVQRVGLDSIAAIQRVNPDKSVFDVESESPPGYMRTLSFTSFDGRNWRIQPTGSPLGSESRNVPPADLPLHWPAIQLPTSDAAFPLADLHGNPSRQMTISVLSGAGALVPIPLDAATILGAARKQNGLALDVHGNVRPGSLDNRFYQVLCGNFSSPPLASTYQQSLLQVPKVDRPYLRRLAELLADGESQIAASEAADRVAKFFQREFEYTLETIKPRLGELRSPMRAFLEDRHAAHCEYFASATVLLLRSLQIPSRLSTGYLVYEFNDEADSYQATNGNAHAWAEYFHEASGRWMVVESTPGIPAYLAQFSLDGPGAATEERSQKSERGWLVWRSLSDALRFMFHALAVWLMRLLNSRFAWLSPLAALALLYWIRKLKLRRRQPKLSCEDRVSEWTKKADALALQWGYRRDRHETCQQFASRLREERSHELDRLAAWYTSFEGLRYRSAWDEEGTHGICVPEIPSIARPDKMNRQGLA